LRLFFSVLGQWSQNSAMSKTFGLEGLDLWLKIGENDATWVLTSSFVILTMQSGFGLLESGCMPEKFVVNIMMKNVVDVVFGGFSYWLIGYGLSYGTSWNGFCGSDLFILNESIDIKTVAPEALEDAVDYFSHYIFQFTFAATATTIVSGCVAGRMKFTTYCLFSFLNTFVYCVPAHWVWHGDGFLFGMGAVDFAGDGPVHLLGAVNGLVGTMLLGPRIGWPGNVETGGGTANCIFGLFLLWWGWLGFNCGSTFGISGSKWLIASRVAVTTINASVGGGLFAVGLSLWQHRKDGLIVEPGMLSNSVLAGLVGITGGCAAVTPAEALFMGAVAAAFSELTNQGFAKMEWLDDPVGAIGVHGSAAMWGLISIGLFADSTLLGGPDDSGIFHGGSFKLLGVQVLTVVLMILWTIPTSWILFKILDWTMHIRATHEAETLGFDWSEHRVKSRNEEDARKLLIEIEELERYRDFKMGKLPEDAIAAQKIENAAAEGAKATDGDAAAPPAKVEDSLQQIVPDPSPQEEENWTEV